MSLLPALSLLVLTLLAAISDARSGLIPNRLTIPALLLAPLAQLVTSGPGALVASLLGAALCGLVPLLLFMRGGIGGGDVKLFTAIGAIAGLETGLEIQLGSYLVAVAIALAIAWRRASARALLWRVARVLSGRMRAVASSGDGPELTEQRLGVPVLLACLGVLALNAQALHELLP